MGNRTLESKTEAGRRRDTAGAIAQIRWLQESRGGKMDSNTCWRYVARVCERFSAWEVGVGVGIEGSRKIRNDSWTWPETGAR